jgi:type 1 glutamine amidotransferase
MRCLAIALAVVLTFAIPPVSTLADEASSNKPKRLLLVTHSGGFIHDSVAVAEQVLKEIVPKVGFQVTCFRFTGDPNAENGKALENYSKRFRERTGEAVTAEQCGRINAKTLQKFDVVLFFTTGNPVTKDELKDLINWVEKGGAFAGTHCATDTLYGTAYGQLIGAFFAGHPWHQEVKLKLEDPKHPATKGFENGSKITDEIYQFSDTPYSRDHLHIILSIDNSSIDVNKGARKDQDYPVSWCHEVGKGKAFYTSLGHRKEVWKDERFQKHLIGGLKWALGLEKGDATPSAKAKKTEK